MTAGRWPSALVATSGLCPALVLHAWESQYRKSSVLGWEVLPLLLVFPVASLLVWRVSSAALAVWSGLDIERSRPLDALTHLPLFLMAGALVELAWSVPSGGSRFAVVAGVLLLAAKGGLFWARRPRGLAPPALRGRGLDALRTGAEASRHPLALVLLALLLLGVRLLHLSADPPVELGPSGGAWTDPGEWAHNARNKLLLGQWVWDEVNFMYVSPLINLCFYLLFLVLGIGYAQVGLLSVLFSLATLVLFYLALAPSMGRGGALLSTLLLGGNYLYITYNRVGLVETPAVFFQVLTLYFGQRGMKDARFFALAGAASLVPLAVKMQMAYIFPAALLSVLLVCLRRPGDPADGPRFASALGYFLGGAAAALLVLGAVWLVPYRAEIRWRLDNEWRLHSLPANLPDLVHNVYFNPFFGYFYDLGSRVLLLLSGVYVFRLLLRLLRGPAAVPFPQIFAFWWFVGGFSYLAISQYRPLRYYVSLIPPMAILAGSALLGLWRARRVATPPGPLSVWVASLGLVVAALAGIQYWYARLAAVQRVLVPLPLYPVAEKDLAVLAAIVALVLSALAFRGLGPRLPRLAGLVPPWVPRGLAAVLVVLFFVGEGRSYLDWKLHRGYKLVSISRRLGAILPAGSVIAGIYAPILALENRHRALAIWDRYGNWEGDPLARFGVTHVVVMAYLDEIGYYQRRFPAAMGGARLLDEWILWKTRVSLYELPRRG